MSYNTRTDMAIDEDRQVFLGDEGDMQTVEGFDYIAQSLVIAIGDDIRKLIAGPTTQTDIKRLEGIIEEAIMDESFISSVSTVRVTEVSDNKVDVTVLTDVNDSVLTLSV